jgi:Flp pilus assembly protein CpaB
VPFTDRNRLFILAAGSAVAAGAVVWLFLHHVERTYQETGETMIVLIARRYIPRGAELRPAYFQSRAVPKAYVQPGAVVDFDILESSPGHPRFRGLLPLLQGTQLVSRDMGPLSSGESLSQVLPENQVAVSFGVDAVRGIGGNLRPGDLLDILHTPREMEGSAVPRPTGTLLQAVPLIAVGKQWREAPSPAQNKEKVLFPESSEDGPMVLTVQVNPLAAVRLVQARENETLGVVLRSPGDVRILENLP